MKNTSRRNFIAGLATATIATPAIASTSIENDKQKDTWDDVKLGLKYAISGYVMCQAYEEMTATKLSEIRMNVGRMLQELYVHGIIYDHKVVASVKNEKELNVKVGFKKKPGVEFTIWDFTTVLLSHNKGLS